MYVYMYIYIYKYLAEGLGSDVAQRVEWIEADLGAWTPPRGAYDLVVCLHVHSAGPLEGMVRR